MNTSGCPACCWLLCLQYICVVLNHLASPTLQGICPVQALEGTTPDISFLLHFSFYEPVYYRIDSSEPDLNFPSSSNEKKGYWVGFADNQGDSLTWRILTEDTQKIIIRSGVRSALRTTTNQRLASPSGEGTTLPFPIPYPQQSSNSLPHDPLDASTPNFEQFVKSQSGEDEDNPIPMANIDIPNLLGRSFLLPPEDNGECHMAKIIDIDDHGQPLEDIKFKLKINKDQAEEIMSYNQLMDYIQKGTDAEEDPDSLFKFRGIIAHQGPLESTDPNHKGSKYNVMVEWESGEVTYEPLTLISKDDPITCAVYAKKHDLLDTTGWKHLKRYAKTSKRLIRAIKQSRIRQVRASARYQHGFQVPKDYNDAMRLDKENGNTHWQDAMDLELTQIHEYKVFKDTGKAKFHNGKVVTPDGFQNIRVHFVYAVKHDGRFKARLVADGHLTKEPVESIYSGVVSLRSLRMVVFLSQLNNLEIWGADVGNAYLEAYTDEKLCDRIPSTTPGAEPPRDAKDSGSARPHSMHLETSSSNRPLMVTYMESHTVLTYMSVKCTRRTLGMPSFTRAPHAQPSLSNFTRRDSDFGEPTRSRGTTRLEQNFPPSPQNRKTKLSHRSLYMPMRTISTPQLK